MQKHATPYLDMIATHLNAPYGLVVQTAHIIAALRSSDLSSVPGDALVKELLAGMFIELERECIGRACFEAGVRLEEAEALYQQARTEFGLPKAVRWEAAMEGVL